MWKIFGAMIAPVLRPSVYFMADGKFGVKMSISLVHGYRLVSNPESTEGASGVLYTIASTEDLTRLIVSGFGPQSMKVMFVLCILLPNN